MFLALVPDFNGPLWLHWTRMNAAFPANDHPVTRWSIREAMWPNAC